MAQLKPGTTIGGRNIVQELDSHVTAAAPHSGHETPAGAQAKAEAAAGAVQAELDAHLAESMPHRFKDGDKVYRWGFRILDGQPQFIYEEVDE